MLKRKRSTMRVGPTCRRILDIDEKESSPNTMRKQKHRCAQEVQQQQQKLHEENEC